MRNKVLKALADTTWGMDKETIITIYKAIGRSLQFGPHSCVIHNGCVKMTNIKHLHEESQMLSMRKHNELLTKQYLIACYLQSHPNHHIVMNNPTPRRIRLDFRTYNSGPTVSKGSTTFPTSDDGHDNHGKLHISAGMKGRYQGLPEPSWPS